MEQEQVNKLEKLLGKREYEIEQLKQHLAAEVEGRRRLEKAHKAQITEINMRLKQLDKNVQLACVRESELSAERDRCKRLLAELPTVKEYRDKCQKMRVESANNQLLQSKVKSLEKTLTDTRHELTSKSDLLQCTQFECRRLSSECAEVKEKLKVESEANPESVNRLLTTLHCARQENDALKRLVSKKQSEIEECARQSRERESGLREEVEARGREETRLREEVAASNRTVQELEDTRNKLERELVSVRSEVVRVENDVALLSVESGEADAYRRVTSHISACCGKMTNLVTTCQMLITNQDPSVSVLLGYHEDTRATCGADGGDTSSDHNKMQCDTVEDKCKLVERLSADIDQLMGQIRNLYIDQMTSPADGNNGCTIQ